MATARSSRPVPAAGITTLTSNLVLNKDNAVGDVWVANGNSIVAVGGTVNKNFNLTSLGGVQIGNSSFDFVHEKTASVVDIRASGGSILRKDAGSTISFGLPGGSLDLQGHRAPSAHSSPATSRDIGAPSTSALNIAGVSTLTGTAPGRLLRDQHFRRQPC